MQSLTLARPAAPLAACVQRPTHTTSFTVSQRHLPNVTENEINSAVWIRTQFCGQSQKSLVATATSPRGIEKLISD